MLKRNILNKILIPYILNLVIFGLAVLVYINLPYYQSFLPMQAEQVFSIFFLAYLIFGLPYYIVKNRYFKNPSLERTTIVLDFFMRRVPRKIVSLYTKERTPKLFDKKVKVALLPYAVKFFFLPIMLAFLVGNVIALIGYLGPIQQGVGISDIFFSQIYYIIYWSIFVLDVSISTFGYAVETPFLKNQIKSVDLTLFGWAVCLACYPPFNNITSNFFPLNYGTSIFNNHLLLQICELASLFLFSFYVWATVSLGKRFSNLSNRGVVSSGAYGVVRHPAYAAKNLAWWFQYLPYMSSIVTPIALIAWNFIYYLRAVTEEKHLMKDPEYRRYVKKVPYRFIPYVW